MPKLRIVLQILQSRLLRYLTLSWAAICYLLEPDAAFMAVIVAVFLDFLTKLVALAVQNQGFLSAVRAGKISSKKALLGTLIKLVAYFALGVMATQVQYVASLEVAAVLSKTVVYSFLFTVEAISILENIVQSGLTHLTPLLSFSIKVLEQQSTSVSYLDTKQRIVDLFRPPK